MKGVKRTDGKNARTEANLAYKKRAGIKRVALEFKPDDYIILQEHAEQAGLPIATYVKQAINAAYDKQDNTI